MNPAAFNKPGRIEFTFDTGQGRVPGSQTAILVRQELVDIIGIVETQLRSEVKLGLDQYTSQTIELNASMGGFSVPVASRLFTAFPLEIQAIEVEQPDGSFVRYNGPSNQALFFDTFDIHAAAFPGRTTIVQVFLDDATLSFDEGTQQVNFDRPRFESINYHPIDNRINGFLSDYIMFDISSVGNKPQMSVGGDATRVYFSGDSIALSLDPVVGGAPFEVLTPIAPPIEGLVTPPRTSPIASPGAWTIRQVDPRDLSNILRITAGQGIWRPYTDPSSPDSLILNVGTFECFIIPDSEEPDYADLDGNGTDKQEIIIIARDLAGNITDMYFGEAEFVDTDPDPKVSVFEGTFAAWPIENVDDGSAVNEVNGTLTNIAVRSGVPIPRFRDIRSGAFAFTGGSIPSSFQPNGTFLVIRL